MNDLRAEIRFKNAVLYNALVALYGQVATEERASRDGKHRAGLSVIRTASQITGINPKTIGDYLNLKLNPRSTKTGLLLRNAELLAFVLEIDGDVLFPVGLYEWKLPKMVVKEFASREIVSLQAIARKASRLPSPQGLLEQAEAKGLIEEVLMSLPAREAIVIRSRFGLDCEEQTLAEVGQKLHVTGERVREIEAAALRKLRNPLRNEALRPYAFGC